jgi:hypothetical protein
MMTMSTAGLRTLHRDRMTGPRSVRVLGRRVALLVVLALVLPAAGVGAFGPASPASANGCPLAGLEDHAESDPAGSRDNPYKVADVDDLLKVALCDGPDVHFRQTEVLDMSGTTYAEAPVPGSFLGLYDGSGLDIVGLHIDARIDAREGPEQPVGLFAEIGEGGTVRGVRLVDVTIEADSDDVGALAGRVRKDGLVLGVAVLASGPKPSSVTVTGNQARVGGVVGSVTEGGIIAVTVEGLFVVVTGTQSTDVGGVVGLAERSELFLLEFSGLVSGGLAVGGVVGALRGSQLVQSFASGNISSSGLGMVGGLVGHMYAYEDEGGDEGGEEPLNGLGEPELELEVEPEPQEWMGSFLLGSVFDGLVDGRQSVGGAVGSLENGALQEVFAGGVVRAADGDVGGIIGFGADSDVRRSVFVGEVLTTGTDGAAAYKGGIAGRLVRSFVVESLAEGAIGSPNELSGGVAGGVVGLLEDGSVLYSSATMTVGGTGDALGGIAGRLVATAAVFISCGEGPDDDVVVSSGFAQVFGSWSAASSGGLTGGPAMRGIVGQVFEDSASASCDDVSGAAEGVAIVTDSFWETDDPTTSDFGLARTAAQMRSVATYLDTSDGALDEAWSIVAGWVEQDDDGPVWGICAEVNDGYPILLWLFSTLPDEACIVLAEEEIVVVDPVVPAPVTPTTPAPVVPAPVTPAPGSVDAPSAAASNVQLACVPTPVRIGDVVTCTVSGAAGSSVVQWRAAYNPTFADGSVTIDGAGGGTFAFLVPAAALGQTLTVELVGLLEPSSLGGVEGPLPLSIPAGEGERRMPTLPALALLAAAGLALPARRRAAEGRA